jgi:hypothetical protein
MEAVTTGSLEGMPVSLAHYYQPLHEIVSGDLWSLERLETILRFNAGDYDVWKDAYLHPDK